MVGRLIAGNGVYICDQCIGLCMNILEESGEAERDQWHSHNHDLAPKEPDYDIAELLIIGFIFLWAVSFVVIGAHNPFIYFNF